MKSHIFPRHTRSNLPVAVRGEGSYIFDDSGNDETGFLQPLRAVISSKKTPAEIMLDHYHGDWAKNIDQVFTSNQY